MFIITKEFSFSASHVLEGLPEGHPCGRLHGHNYRVQVELQSPTLDKVGFVRDYGKLKLLQTYLDSTFDHRHLNDVLIGLQPSAENLARHFYDWCKARWAETAAVQVSETAKTWAEYKP